MNVKAIQMNIYESHSGIMFFRKMKNETVPYLQEKQAYFVPDSCTQDIGLLHIFLLLFYSTQRVTKCTASLFLAPSHTQEKGKGNERQC